MYTREPTKGQDLVAQMERLKVAGCKRFLHEKQNGSTADDHPQLQKLLALLQPADVVLATVTDRIARDPLDMLNLLTRIRGMGAGLRLLDSPSSTPRRIWPTWSSSTSAGRRQRDLTYKKRRALGDLFKGQYN